MNTYIINFHSESNSYNDELQNAIKSISDEFINVFNNTWIVFTPEISLTLENIFSKILKYDEKILISSTNGDCAGVHIDGQVIEFFNSYT